jgi:hypothetical protein
MKTLLASFAAILLVGSASPTQAQVSYSTGNDLYRDCSVPPENSIYYQSNAACISYIVAVNDSFVIASTVASIIREEPESEQINMLCVPTGVEAGQLRDVVVAYIRNDPANRHGSAALQVYLALITAFPCR